MLRSEVAAYVSAIADPRSAYPQLGEQQTVQVRRRAGWVSLFAVKTCNQLLDPSG